MMLKKGVLLLVILMCSCFLASAASFEVTKNPIKNVINIDEVAEYKLTIYNKLDKVQNFRIKTLDFPIWDVYTRPVANPIVINVGGNLSRTIKLYVDPLHVMSEGTTDVNVQVSLEGTDEKGIVPLRVTVSSVKPQQGYVSTVISNIKIPEEIDPSQDVKITMNFNNQNILSYDNLLVSFKSNSINYDFETSLNSSEEKYDETTIKLDPKTPPQKDTVIITLYSDGNAISKPMTSKIEILPYSNIVLEEKSMVNIFGKSKEVKFTNEGNIENEDFPQIETSLFVSLFTSTEPKAKRYTKLGKTYFYWEETIQPYESLEVRVSENYIVLFVLIIIAVLTVIVYYKTKSPLRILKSSADVKMKEGGIHELSVMLTLKNDSKDKITEIKISDRIPHIVKIDQDITIGTLKPIKLLTHETKGTLVVWKLEGLNAGEERVIKYKIKSALSIIGNLKLPSAKAKFNHNGKQWITKSNGLMISS